MTEIQVLLKASPERRGGQAFKVARPYISRVPLSELFTAFEFPSLFNGINS